MKKIQQTIAVLDAIINSAPNSRNLDNLIPCTTSSSGGRADYDVYMILNVLLKAECIEPHNIDRQRILEKGLAHHRQVTYAVTDKGIELFALLRQRVEAEPSLGHEAEDIDAKRALSILLETGHIVENNGQYQLTGEAAALLISLTAGDTFAKKIDSLVPWNIRVVARGVGNRKERILGV